MNGPSHREFDRWLRDGAHSRIARTRSSGLRERVLCQLEERERAPAARATRWRTRRIAVLAAAAVIAAVVLVESTRDRASVPEVVGQSPAVEVEPRWHRVLVDARDPTLALRREAESLRDDTRNLLRRLAGRVRLGPASERASG